MFAENAPNYVNYEQDGENDDDVDDDDLFSYSNVDVEFGDVDD